MTILELQKRLKEIYEKCDDIDVSIQNGDDGGEYPSFREVKNVEVEGEYPNEMVILSYKNKFMNREEEINQATSEYIITDKTCGVGVRTQAFIDGAKWADEHPKSPWHSIADGDLPEVDKRCLLSFQGAFYIGFRYAFNNVFLEDEESFFTDINDIDYWMEIPKLPND